MSKEAPRFEAVALPNEVFERGGVEVLRAIIVEGGLHVSMRRTFDTPGAWGPLLAEVARDIARVYAAADARMAEHVALAMICAAFSAETVPGTEKETEQASTPRRRRTTPRKSRPTTRKRRKRRKG